MSGTSKCLIKSYNPLQKYIEETQKDSSMELVINKCYKLKVTFNRPGFTSEAFRTYKNILTGTKQK